MTTTDQIDTATTMTAALDLLPAPLATPPPDPRNHVLVVGTLERAERTRRRARPNAMGVVTTTVNLLLQTPFGEPFSIPLTLAGAAQEQERQHAGRGAVAVEGRLQLRNTNDRRFADETEIFGRRTDAMQIVVDTIRDLRDGEQPGTSFACLDGVVDAEPVFRRHPTLPDLEYALITLAVEERRAPAFPGSQIVRMDRTLVRVAVPTTLPGAELLYRPGNHVQVQGELDCVLVLGLPRNADDQAAVQRVEQEWQTAQATYAPGSDELRQAQRRYMGQRRNMEETARWRVLAGYVRGLEDAEPRTRQDARKERRAAQRQNGGLPPRAAAADGTAEGEADTADALLPAELIPETAPAVRPRARRSKAVAAADDVTDNETVADAGAGETDATSVDADADAPDAANAVWVVTALDAADAVAVADGVAANGAHDDEF